MQLDGKTAAITGASRGMGAAFARRFAREGAAVSLAARDAATLNEVAAEIEAAGGVALATQTDVTSPEQVSEYAARTLDRFGTVDILVNNAGGLLFGTLLQQDDDAWNAMLDVNLNSARWVTRAFLPTMLEQGGGKVIFMSSNAAKRGFAGHVGSAVAKAGLMALNRSIAVEYGTQGIESFCVNVGLVAETDMGEATVAAGADAFGGLE
jgi:NAD(P)-dependent dehydrogenase (short-subunit alcohol dehydrogenase family)